MYTVKRHRAYGALMPGAGCHCAGALCPASGGGSDAVFYENSLTVTTSYTITANSGAHAVGPLTINSGQTVTVPATSHLVIS